MVLLPLTGFGVKALVRLELGSGDVLSPPPPAKVIVVEFRCPRVCCGILFRPTCVIFGDVVACVYVIRLPRVCFAGGLPHFLVSFGRILWFILFL